MLTIFTIQQYALIILFNLVPHINSCHVTYHSTSRVRESIDNNTGMVKPDVTNLSYYTFTNICSPSQNYSTCFFLSPENNSYFTFPKNGENCTYFEQERICIEYTKLNMCSIKIKNVLPKDVGVWRCFYRKRTKEKVIDHDAVVLRRTDLVEQLHLFDSFNISHSLFHHNKHFRMIHISPIFIVSGVVITFLLLYLKGFISVLPTIVKKH